TLGLSFLRKLQLETLKDGVGLIRGVLPQEVADYLVNKKRKEILDLELRREVSIRIEGNPNMLPRESKIISENRREN
ncbi:MAG: ribonuclease, partial [Desulfococcaceae bacterium]